MHPIEYKFGFPETPILNMTLFINLFSQPSDVFPRKQTEKELCKIFPFFANNPNDIIQEAPLSCAEGICSDLIGDMAVCKIITVIEYLNKKSHGREGGNEDWRITKHFINRWRPGEIYCRHWHTYT